VCVCVCIYSLSGNFAQLFDNNLRERVLELAKKTRQKLRVQLTEIAN